MPCGLTGPGRGSHGGKGGEQAGTKKARPEPRQEAHCLTPGLSLSQRAVLKLPHRHPASLTLGCSTRPLGGWRTLGPCLSPPDHEPNPASGHRHRMEPELASPDTCCVWHPGQSQHLLTPVVLASRPEPGSRGTCHVRHPGPGHCPLSDRWQLLQPHAVGSVLAASMFACVLLQT